MRRSLSLKLSSVGLIPFSSFALVISLNLLVLSVFFSQDALEPYMDEEFHIPQAQRFCASFLPSFYHPSITTPPGLYWFASSLLRVLSFLSQSVQKAEASAANKRVSSSSCSPFAFFTPFPSSPPPPLPSLVPSSSAPRQKTSSHDEEEEEDEFADGAGLRLSPRGREEGRRKKNAGQGTSSATNEELLSIPRESTEREEEEEAHGQIPWTCCSAMYFRAVNALLVSPLILLLLWKLVFLIQLPKNRTRRRERKRHALEHTKSRGEEETSAGSFCLQFAALSSSSTSPAASSTASEATSSESKNQREGSSKLMTTRGDEEEEESGGAEEEKKRPQVTFCQGTDGADGAERSLAGNASPDRKRSLFLSFRPWSFQKSRRCCMRARGREEEFHASSDLGCTYTSAVAPGVWQRTPGQKPFHTKEGTFETREEEEEKKAKEKNDEEEEEAQEEGDSFDLNLLVSVRVLRMAFFPLLYFFSFLFYTDVLAVLFLLLAYFHLLTSKHLWGYAFAGVSAFFVRQSSIVWLGGGFLFVIVSTMHFVFSRCSLRSCEDEEALSSSSSCPFTTIQHPPLASSFASASFSPFSSSSSCSSFFLLLRQLVNQCRSLVCPKLFISLCLGLPLLLPFLVFLVFFLANGGRIAVGHQAFHQPAVHTAQLLYVTLFLIPAASPATLCRTVRRTLWFVSNAASSSALVFPWGASKGETSFPVSAKGTTRIDEKEERKGGGQAEMQTVGKDARDSGSLCKDVFSTGKKDEKEEDTLGLGRECKKNSDVATFGRQTEERRRKASDQPSSRTLSRRVACLSGGRADLACFSSACSFLSGMKVSCLIALLFLFFSCSAGFFGTVAHPFLLSDNRHLTFYLWRRVFRFPFFRCIVGPLMATVFLVFGDVPSSLRSPPLPAFLSSLLKRKKEGSVVTEIEKNKVSEKKERLLSPGFQEEKSCITSTTFTTSASCRTAVALRDSKAACGGGGSSLKTTRLFPERGRTEVVHDEEMRNSLCSETARTGAGKNSEACKDTAARKSTCVPTRHGETSERCRKEGTGELDGDDKERFFSELEEGELKSWTLISFPQEREGGMALRRRKRREIAEVVEEENEDQGRQSGEAGTPESSGVRTVPRDNGPGDATSPSSVSLSSACILSSLLDEEDDSESNEEHDRPLDLSTPRESIAERPSEAFPSDEPLVRVTKTRKKEAEDERTSRLLFSVFPVEQGSWSLDAIYSCACFCIYTVCIVLLLVPAALLELRYFLFVLVIFLLHERFLLFSDSPDTEQMSVEHLRPDTVKRGRSERVMEKGERTEDFSCRPSNPPASLGRRRWHQEKKEERTEDVKDLFTEDSGFPYSRVIEAISKAEVKEQKPTFREILKKFCSPVRLLVKCMYTRQNWVDVYLGKGGYEAALLNEMLALILNLVGSLALFYVFAFHSFIGEDGKIARFMF